MLDSLLAVLAQGVCVHAYRDMICSVAGLANMGPGARGSAMDGSSAPHQNSDSDPRWLCEWYEEPVNTCRA